MTLVVFSDLDGTLLDHARYDWRPAAPALAALRRRGVPLVLATSKTAAEVGPLHAELALGETPAIVENGAGVYRPGHADKPATGDYARLRAALDTLPPEIRASFRGFGDMSAAEVARLTGLTEDAAILARRRVFSEPGLWTGTAAGQAAFQAALAAQGIAARQGGRFLTLSFGRSKADAMAEVARDLGATETIALGDAPNDIEMLQSATHGVIVRNDHGPGMPRLPEEASGRIRRTTAPGPAGWSEAVLDLLGETEGG